jgi:molecular chaperone Hsp33
MSKIANDNPVEQDGAIKDDIILPFQLQESGLRGRAIRMGSTLDDILNAHQYPEAISHLLADTIALTAALSSMLKFEGIFTLQASGKGVIKTLVSDMDSNGNIRGCAAFSNDDFDKIKPSGDGLYDGYTLADLMGEGYLAFTVDQGEHTERYQGIVALEGDVLQQSVTHYFEQSEQLRTSLYVASNQVDGQWRSGALMLQFLPDDNEDADVVAFNDKTDNERNEDWQRSKILLQSCTADEITDKNLHINELLRRLFHEEGVIVYSEQTLTKKCRCSMDRVQNVVDGLSADDREHAAKDGKIEMTCEFCSQTYTIDVN